MANALSLPVELWHKVFSYLPRADVLNVRFVNTLLDDYARPWAWLNISMGPVLGPHHAKLETLASNPDLGRHVQHLWISFNENLSSAHTPPVSRGCGDKKYRQLVDRLQPADIHAPVSKRLISFLLLLSLHPSLFLAANFVQQLTRLKQLTVWIDTPCLRFSKSLLALHSQLWTNIPMGSLRQIQFSIHSARALKGYAALIRASNVDMPSLEVLILDIHPARFDRNNPWDDLPVLLAPMRAHMRKLIIGFPGYCSWSWEHLQSTHPVLDFLGDFPNLSDLQISLFGHMIYIPPTWMESYRRFLHRHKTTLKTIALETLNDIEPFSWTDGIATFGSCQAPAADLLPKLEGIYLNYETDILETSRPPDLTPFARSLTTLVLTYHLMNFYYENFQFSELERVIKSLDTGKGALLERFKVTIANFSPEALDLMETHLPRLQVLEIGYLQLVADRNDETTGGRTDVFWRNLNARPAYTKWGVRQLYICDHEDVQYRVYDPKRVVVSSVLRKIADRIPSVRILAPYEWLEVYMRRQTIAGNGYLK